MISCKIILILVVTFVYFMNVQSRHTEDSKICGVNKKLSVCTPTPGKPCPAQCECKTGFVEVEGKDYCVPKDVKCSKKHILDLVFIIDSTKSITENMFNDIKVFMTETVVQIYSSGTDVRVGVIIYGPQNPNIIYLYETEKLCDAIQQISAVLYTPNEGKINLIDALNIAEHIVFSQCNGARIGSVKQIIVIGSFSDVSAEAKERLMKGIHEHQTECNHHLEFIAINVGFNISEKVHQFNVKTTKELDQIHSNIFEVTCKAESCSHGYQKVGDNCVDVNECDSAPCHKSSTCFNVPGSFFCYCPNDQEYLGIEKGCGKKADECSETEKIITVCNAVTCKEPGKCTNSNGMNFCICPSGYSYDTKLGCINVNECITNPCLRDGICKDTNGSFECSCSKGFQYNVYFGCVDIDECQNSKPCSGVGVCQNTIGSYDCTCNPGYNYIQDKGCIDIDECTTKKANCQGENVECKNTPGSYDCVCQPGYEYTSNGCVDINECNKAGTCPEYSSCVNTIPGFNCICNKGFLFNQTTNLCELDKTKDLIQPRVDLVFVVDTSDAIKNYMDSVKELVVSIINDYKSQALAVIKRYFALTTGGDSKVNIIFTALDDSTVLKATDNIVFTGGKSLLSEGLKQGRNLYLTGGQVNSSRLVIAITASKPSNCTKEELDAIRQQANEIKKDGKLLIIYIGENVQSNDWKVIFTDEEIALCIITVTQEFMKTIHKVIYQNTERLIKCPDGFVYLDKVCQYKTAAAVYCKFDNKLYALNTVFNISCAVYNCTENGVVLLDRSCAGHDGDCYKDDAFFPCMANNVLNWRCQCRIENYFDEVTKQTQQRMTYLILRFDKEAVVAKVKLQDPTQKCELPFKYNGEWQYACTDARSYSRWCSQDIYYANRYAYCVSDVTTKCVFKGETYNEGQTWKVNCNTVTCSAGLASITPRCLALNQTCVPFKSSNYPCMIGTDKYESCTCVTDSDGYGENAALSGKVESGAINETGVLVKFCQDRITNTSYEVGKEFVKNCFTLVCTESGQTKINSKKCEAKDGKCIIPDSKDFFTCDMNGKVKDNCQCITENEEVVLIVKENGNSEKETVDYKKFTASIKFIST